MDDLWKLAGGGAAGLGLGGVLVLWLVRVLIPRLQDQLDRHSSTFAATLEKMQDAHATEAQGQRERFTAYAERERGDFLTALAAQRDDFREVAQEQRVTLEGVRTTSERVAVQLARLCERLDVGNNGNPGADGR